MATYTVAFRPSDTGLSLTDADFDVFEKLSDGTSPTNAAPSTITEVGVGVYKFTYTAAEDVVFVLDGGAGIPDTDRYVRGVLSPMDERLDAAITSRAAQTDVDQLLALQEGRWKIHTSGPDANRLVIYDTDDVTPLIKFDLLDSAGDPTFSTVFERTPV